jgi:hypothetical protein
MFKLLKGINMQTYCDMVEALPKGCMRENFLELWKSNSEVIGALTKEKIIFKLNKSDVSPETGHVAKFTTMLGDTKVDANGKIIAARSLLSSWMLHINFSDVNSDKLGNMAGTEGELLQLSSDKTDSNLFQTGRLTTPWHSKQNSSRSWIG